MHNHISINKQLFSYLDSASPTISCDPNRHISVINAINMFIRIFFLSNLYILLPYLSISFLLPPSYSFANVRRSVCKIRQLQLNVFRYLHKIRRELDAELLTLHLESFCYLVRW